MAAHHAMSAAAGYYPAADLHSMTSQFMNHPAMFGAAAAGSAAVSAASGMNPPLNLSHPSAAAAASAIAASQGQFS